MVTDKALSIPAFLLLMSQEYMDNVKKFYLASVESADFKKCCRGKSKDD